MRLWLSLLLLLFVNPVTAQGVDMRGAGSLGCSEWIYQRGSNDFFSAGNWMLGFLSGSAWDSGNNILAGRDSEDLFIAIDKYCSEHPGDTLSDATVALAYHLLKQAQSE